MTDKPSNRTNEDTADGAITDRPPKGVYILPNLFTTAGLFAGFFSIIQATQSQFGSAAIAILVAMIMDGLDGRIARWTNTTSDFGREYDSLADVIAFGLAPALLMYEWLLGSMGKAGWIVAFLFVAGAAMRLARFNTVDSPDKRYFQGLPCPAAAAAAASFVWLSSAYEWSGALTGVVTAFVSLGLTLGMISGVRYRSFKELDLKERVSFDKAFLFAIIIGIVFWEPPLVLCVVSMCYALSGPTAWLKGKMKRRHLPSWEKDSESDPTTTDAVAEDASSKPVKEEPARDSGERSSTRLH